jgi:hypothetical protein
MSRSTAIVHSLRLACRVESVWSSRMGFVMECCGRKPNCCWGMMSVSRIVLKQVFRIFSKIFLGIIMVEVVFQDLGKYEVLRQLLSRAWQAGLGSCLRRMGFILSGPGALVFLSCLMWRRISSSVISCVRLLWGGGISEYLDIWT